MLGLVFQQIDVQDAYDSNNTPSFMIYGVTEVWRSRISLPWRD